MRTTSYNLRKRSNMSATTTSTSSTTNTRSRSSSTGRAPSGNQPLGGPGGGGGGAGGAGAPGGGGPSPPNQPVPFQNPVFALTPAQVNPQHFIDYSTQTGIKLYNAATASLPNKFDLDSKNANVFCEQLMSRAHESGWNQPGGDILSTLDDNGVTRNLITNYAQLTKANILISVRTYIGNQNRRAQNSVQLYYCLVNSLTEEAQLMIVEETDEYYEQQTPVGELLFKLLIQKATVDSRSTASHLRDNLATLDVYMTTVNSNIETFNQYVKVNKQGLKARGQRTDDMMTNLFRGYLAASDRDFVTYILRKKDEYEDGEDITDSSLMSLALNKYKTQVRDGKWNQLSPEQEQIVALNANIQELKDDNLKLSKAISSKKSKSKDKEKKLKKKGKRNKSNKSKSKNNGKWAWKDVPPKEGESHTKKVDDKEYHWCDEHLAWGVHTEDDCDLKKKREKARASAKSIAPKGKQKKSSSSSAYASALTSILQDVEKEDAGSSDSDTS